MPFGVCNGPATFQSLIQATMSDLFFQILLVYLGDILVYSETFEQHLEPGQTQVNSDQTISSWQNYSMSEDCLSQRASIQLLDMLDIEGTESFP